MTQADNLKRSAGDTIERVQEGNRTWWDRTPMTYDWRAEPPPDELPLPWFDDQDRRSILTHRFFATDEIPFDRLIPYPALRGKEVLEIGVGSGFHSELLARAGVNLTGIDLTATSVRRTRRRFDLKNLEGSFEQWDAERPRADFARRFDYVWSWGVIHHSSRTARIVRNVAEWLTDDGSFGGMVYHRDSASAFAAVVGDGVLRGNLRSRSIDETLWRVTDGFSARFYPADQWRDLLLGFFDAATIAVTGHEADAVPLPRGIREHILRRLSAERVQRAIGRRGSFVTFDASHPLRVS